MAHTQTLHLNFMTFMAIMRTLAPSAPTNTSQDTLVLFGTMGRVGALPNSRFPVQRSPLPRSES